MGTGIESENRNCVSWRQSGQHEKERQTDRQTQACTWGPVRRTCAAPICGIIVAQEHGASWLAVAGSAKLAHMPSGMLQAK